MEVLDGPASPGIQSLALDMEEVQVVKRILLAEGPAIILLVVDAKNLKRGLMLYLEAMELQLPLVMAINMNDEARQRGITVDPRAVSSLLGIEACLTSALEGEGISTLRRCLAHATPPARRAIYPGSIQRSLEELAAQLGGEGPARLLCLFLYSGDREARNSLASRWEKALEDHEKSHPQPVIQTLAGEPVGDGYVPKTKSIADDAMDIETADNNPLSGMSGKDSA